MQSLYEVIIVEGKADESRLKALFDALVVEVGGLALRQDSLRKLDILSHYLPMIALFDPDSAGKTIAKRLKKRYPKLRVATLKGKAYRSKNGKKIGLAYARSDLIEESLYQAGASVCFLEKRYQKEDFLFTKTSVLSPLEKKYWADVFNRLPQHEEETYGC